MTADPSGAKEVYLPDHRWLEDAELLALPARGPLTRLTLFVCTYVAKLGNLHIGFVELTRIMCVEPHGCLLAVNSNFGHAAQPGYEYLLKAPKPPPERRVPARGRPRKVQGDGTCFNSAVEPVVAIDHPGISDEKVYFVKCFPTTGETQVPGVICPDLSDGHDVLAAFVAYLNELGVGDPDTSTGAVLARAAAAPRGREPAAGDFDVRAWGPSADAGVPACRKPVVIASEQPKMLNYKFRVIRNSPRVLVDLHRLAIYLQHLEELKISEDAQPSEQQVARFAGWPAVVLPPFTVRETKRPTDDVKVSFRFEGESRAPRINVFQEGKINILGADSVESAERIYDYCVRLFTANWSMLICLQPRRDLERRQARPARLARAPAREAAPPPAPLTDAEVDAILTDVLGDAYDPATYWLAPDPAPRGAPQNDGPAPGAPADPESRAPAEDADLAARPVPDSVVASIVADLDDGWELGDSDSDGDGDGGDGAA